MGNADDPWWQPEKRWAQVNGSVFPWLLVSIPILFFHTTLASFWTAWYRAITLTMVAQAFLARICAQEQAWQALMQESGMQERRLLPLTRPEIRHLLGHLLWPHPQNVSLLLA